MPNIKQSRSLTVEELLELEGPLDPIEPTSQDAGSLRLPKDANIKQLKEDNKYYLPVLYLNDAAMWESRPKKSRLRFDDKQATETCLSNCCGHPGVKNACCLLDPDDLEHILGPVTEKWIKRIVKWFNRKGICVTREDIVIDQEEGELIGANHFNGHKVFNSPDSYPMLRIQAFGPRFACKFLNVHNGKCTIYSQRPDMCQGYYCQYVKSNFLVKAKGTTNTYIRADVEKNKSSD